MSRYPARGGGLGAQRRAAPSFQGRPQGQPANDNVRPPANDFGPPPQGPFSPSGYAGYSGGKAAFAAKFNVSGMLLRYAAETFIEHANYGASPWTSVNCQQPACGPPWEWTKWVYANFASFCTSGCGPATSTTNPFADGPATGRFAVRNEVTRAHPLSVSWYTRTRICLDAGVGKTFPHLPSWYPGRWARPRPVPEVPYWLDPFELQPFQPMPSPVAPPIPALPNLKPNPHRAPSEQPQRGPAPRPRPRPRPRPGEEPVAPIVVPPPVPEPPVVPSPRRPPWFRGEPGGQPGKPPVYRGRPAAGGHQRRPPRAKEKEKKASVPGPVAAAAKAAFAATEALDALDAIYNATGSKAARKAHEASCGKSPQCKAGFVYANAGDIDIPEAIKNLIANQIADAVVGRTAGGAGRQLRNMGSSHQGGIAF